MNVELDIKKFNIFSLESVLLLLSGLIFYAYWGLKFGVWFDVGIYSITIIFVMSGMFGILLTLYKENEDE